MPRETEAAQWDTWQNTQSWVALSFLALQWLNGRILNSGQPGLFKQMRIQTTKPSQVHQKEEYSKQSKQPGERPCSNRRSTVIRAAASESKGEGVILRSDRVLPVEFLAEEWQDHTCILEASPWHLENWRRGGRWLAVLVNPGEGCWELGLGC